MKLHYVTSGNPRISYVVRMVKKGDCVYLSRDTIMKGMMRSDAC